MNVKKNRIKKHGQAWFHLSSLFVGLALVSGLYAQEPQATEAATKEAATKEAQATEVAEAATEAKEAQAKESKLTDQPEPHGPVSLLESKADGPSLMQEGIKTIGMLTVLLVVFWWFSNWLKKSGRLARIAGTGSDIQCVSVFSVGQKEKIALIKVRDQELLIGITPTNIQALHHFTDAHTRDKDAPSGTEFSKILDNAESKVTT